MARTMYDALEASGIPAGGAMGAWYPHDPRSDGPPNTKQVLTIDNAGSHPDCDILDYEPGAAFGDSVAQAWLQAKANAGVQGTIYCNPGNRPSVSLPYHWWAADWTGIPEDIFAGSVAMQYEDAGPYDVSLVVDDSWFPVTPVLPVYPTPAGVGVSVSSNNVTLSWDAVSGATSGYMYEVESFATGQLVLGTPTDTASTSASFSITAPGNYRARVQTHGSTTHDWSAWSEWVDFTIAPPAFPVPTAVTATAATAVTLSWAPVANATGGYMFEVETSAGVSVVPATDTTKTSVSMLLPAGSYQFRVQTHSSPAGNWSAWSAWVPFTL